MNSTESLDEALTLDRSLSLDEAVRVHMFVTKENHTHPAHSARGQVHLHSVLTDSVVQRSSLLQGISESSGACPLPIAQPDVYAWLSVVAARDRGEEEVSDSADPASLPPDMARPASIISAADFFGDTEAYSAAVRQLAQTLYPSLHACLDGHSETLDYPTGLNSKIQMAMTNAFHAEHGISPISQVLLKLPPDVAKQVLALVPCSLLELLSGLPPPLHALALLSKITCSHAVVAHSHSNPRGPPLGSVSAIPSLMPNLLLKVPLLSSLVLDNWQICNHSLQSLSAVLPHLSHLTHLSLSHTMTAPGHISTLAPYLPYMPALLSLRLVNGGIDSVAAASFAQHLTRISCLTALDVSYNPIFLSEDMSMGHPFLVALVALPDLANLSIASTNLSMRTAILLLRMKVTNPSLRTLDLSSCVDYVEGLEDELELSLLALTQLQALNMSWDPEAPPSLPPMAALPVTLTRLHLHEHAARIDAIKLSSCLLPLTALQVLDLSGSDWATAQLLQIRGTLAGLPVLHTLSLLSSQPGPQMLAMLDAMPGLSAIKSLAVCGWTQAEDVDEAVQETLAGVTHLSISYGAHARLATSHLGEQLRDLQRLRKLCLYGHDVCRLMLVVAQPLTALTHLVLVDTRSGPTTVRSRELWMQLIPLAGLEVLELGLNAVHDAAVGAGSWDTELLTHFVLLHKHWPALRELHMQLQNVAKHDLVDGMYIHGVCIRKYMTQDTLQEFV